MSACIPRYGRLLLRELFSQNGYCRILGVKMTLRKLDMHQQAGSTRSRRKTSTTTQVIFRSEVHSGGFNITSGGEAYRDQAAPSITITRRLGWPPCHRPYAPYTVRVDAVTSAHYIVRPNLTDHYHSSVFSSVRRRRPKAASSQE